MARGDEGKGCAPPLRKKKFAEISIFKCVYQDADNTVQLSWLEPEAIPDPTSVMSPRGAEGDRSDRGILRSFGNEGKISISNMVSDSTDKGFEPEDANDSVAKNQRTWIGSVTQPVSAVVTGVEIKVVSAASFQSGTVISAKETLMSGVTTIEEAILGPSDPIDDDDKIRRKGN